MRLRLFHCALAILLLGFAHAGSGLTIFRLGGENLPRPELGGPYEFVQLNWNEIEARHHGSTKRLDFDPDFIRPQQLNPKVNLAPLIEKQGGQILNLVWLGWVAPQQEDFLMYDEDPDTIYLGDSRFSTHGPPTKSIIFDFGARMWLKRIRFSPRQKHLTDRFMQSFRIGINDGDPFKDGTRGLTVRRGDGFSDFDIVHQRTENTEAVIDLELPDLLVRRLLFQADENTRGIWEVAELEIYGTGYVPFTSYVSNVIDLGGFASLGQLSWSGHIDAGAQVDLTMRSGVDDDPNTYWRTTFRGSERTRFDAKGIPLNRASYDKLQSGEQEGITHDTENWVFWSAPYDFGAGTGAMLGDGTRRYVQLRADFTSTQTASSELDYVQFAVSIPPVASRALAEIVPVAVLPGQVTSFTYKLRPTIESEDLGFDSIGIDTPTEARSVDQVRISGVPASFEVVEMGEAGFIVQIPRIDIQRTTELIEVDFQAEVFKFGTVFAGRLFDSQQPLEVPQSVAAGDADELADSNRLSVDLVRFGQRAIGSLTLDPPVFSPNGDGVNDAVQIGYDLLNLVGAVPVQVEVFDLSGRSLGVVLREQAASGSFSVAWDGRDGDNALLSPGLYLNTPARGVRQGGRHPAGSIVPRLLMNTSTQNRPLA